MCVRVCVVKITCTFDMHACIAANASLYDSNVPFKIMCDAFLLLLRATLFLFFTLFFKGFFWLGSMIRLTSLWEFHYLLYSAGQSTNRFASVRCNYFHLYGCHTITTTENYIFILSIYLFMFRDLTHFSKTPKKIVTIHSLPIRLFLINTNATFLLPYTFILFRFIILNNNLEHCSHSLFYFEHNFFFYHHYTSKTKHPKHFHYSKNSLQVNFFYSLTPY